MSTPGEIHARGTTGLRPVPYPIDFVRKLYPPNPRCPSRALCWWHMYICDRYQKRLRVQKAVMCLHFIIAVWAVQHKNKWR